MKKFIAALMITFFAVGSLNLHCTHRHKEVTVKKVSNKKRKKIEKNNTERLPKKRKKGTWGNLNSKNPFVKTIITKTAMEERRKAIGERPSFEPVKCERIDGDIEKCTNSLDSISLFYSIEKILDKTSLPTYLDLLAEEEDLSEEDNEISLQADFNKEDTDSIDAMLNEGKLPICLDWLADELNKPDELNKSTDFSTDNMSLLNAIDAILNNKPLF